MCRACFQDGPILLRLLDDKGALIHIKEEGSAVFVIRIRPSFPEPDES